MLVAADGPGLDSRGIAQAARRLWPTYSGDYTGRRYSALTQINQSNVKNLTLAWAVAAGRPARAGGWSGGPAAARGVRSSSAAKAAATSSSAARRQIKGAMLAVNGVLYVTTPDNVVGARRARRPRDLALLLEDEGRHAHRQPRRRACGATTCTSRRPTTISMSLDARTGKERWHKEHRQLRAAVFLDDRRRSSSATTCSSAPATISTRPGSCSRSIRKPASCSGSSTPCR